MLRTTVTKRFSIDSAHFLPHYEGKCQRVHGHTWLIELTIGGPVDPNTGMIVDFSLIKQVLVDPIKEGLDHYVLNERKLGRSLFKNPTAENIASAIMHWGQAEILKYLTLPVGIYLQQVRVYETPDNYATVSRELDEPGRGIG